MYVGNVALDAPGAQRLWPGRPAPVTHGTGLEGGSRVVSDGPVRLAVVGSCYATEAQLCRELQAVRTRRWAKLTSWPGSYWVVADDGRTTAVLTDVAGTRPVYFTESPSGTGWATAARPLAAAVGAEVDYAAITARLLCPTIPEITGDATAFVGVRRLPGGHALLVERDGRCRTTAYEESHALPFRDAAGDLHQHLVTAITERARSAERLTADFSGGLDSTSLALLAAGDGAELLAVTHADATSANEDVRYAQRAAALHPHLEHVVVTDADGLFFADLLDAPATDQPFPDAARWRMRAAYQRPCVAHGSDVHLTGSGADTLLAASPYYLADLARSGDYPALLRHCRARARLRHLPLYAVLGAAVRLSRTTHARALRWLARDIAVPSARRPDRAARLHWLVASGLKAWLTPDARRLVARRASDTAERCILAPEDTSRHRAWAEVREFGVYEAELRNQAHAVGLPHHAPFLDNNVVRAAMAIPVHARASTRVQKPLLGTALAGPVPDWLLTRRTKGAYDGNAFTGLRRNADILRTLLRGSELATEGWIDARAAVAELDRLAAGAPGRLAALEALIAAELWLRQHLATPTRLIATEAAHA
ncbi:albusnodin/ikarugamycin family macrolactam cyclase [Streptomyces synnematoformans]|uniref:asparagine synthase (glutamine-hydrolyzing) n=1 Tax=Streptomyces synnematoformans TaxID=415721 RepID=A0ABP5J4L6_9ACTN